jgi:uncharacterized phage protein (TIGR02220 family)
MARPRKLNADYFSHDADMRNDRKIKALRSKFGLAGYALFNMILEVITDSDYFQIKLDEIEISLLSADFGVTEEKLRDFLDTCYRLGLLTLNNGILICEKLNERFALLLDKRGKKRQWMQENQDIQEGVLDVQNPSKTNYEEVLDIQNPQSKVKESKVKESKEEKKEKQKEADSAESLRSSKPPPKLKPKKPTLLSLFQKHEPMIQEITEQMNRLYGTRTKPTTENHFKHIVQRLEEGATLNDFLYIIENKKRQWFGNPKMEHCLKSATLFCKTHFQDYLAEKETPLKIQNSSTMTVQEELDQAWEQIKEEQGYGRNQTDERESGQHFGGNSRDFSTIANQPSGGQELERRPLQLN